MILQQLNQAEVAKEATDHHNTMIVTKQSSSDLEELTLAVAASSLSGAVSDSVAEVAAVTPSAGLWIKSLDSPTEILLKHKLVGSNVGSKTVADSSVTTTAVSSTMVVNASHSHTANDRSHLVKSLSLKGPLHKDSIDFSDNPEDTIKRLHLSGIECYEDASRPSPSRRASCPSPEPLPAVVGAFAGANNPSAFGSDVVTHTSNSLDGALVDDDGRSITDMSKSEAIVMMMLRSQQHGQPTTDTVRTNDAATIISPKRITLGKKVLLGCFGIPLSKEPFTVADKQHQGSRCSFSDACGEASDSGSAIRVQPTRGSGYTVDPERRTEDGLSHAYLNNSSLSESETAVTTILSRADDWTFDSFGLSEATLGRPLSTLAFFLFKRYNVIKALSLPEDKLARFLISIEDGYFSNPYHSKVHAADVLRTFHVILHRGGILRLLFPEPIVSASESNKDSPHNTITLAHCTQSEAASAKSLPLLALYLSAIIHDYGHRGVTNAFLIEDEDPLALLYNDSSPMENHHCALAFEVLRADSNNFISHLSKEARRKVRSLMLDMVLGTDMKHHFNLIGAFKTKLLLNPSSCPSSLQGIMPHKTSSASTGDTFSRKLHDSSSRPLNAAVAMSRNVRNGAHARAGPSSIGSSFSKQLSRCSSGLLVLGDMPQSNSLPDYGERSTAGRIGYNDHSERNAFLIKPSALLGEFKSRPIPSGTASVLHMSRFEDETSCSSSSPLPPTIRRVAVPPVSQRTTSQRDSSTRSSLYLSSAMQRKIFSPAARDVGAFTLADMEPPIDEETTALVLKMSLKCADLGHLASEGSVHRRWVAALEEEMFRQGDLEKARGHPSVSPLMDRDKGGITKSQPGFFEAIALPLFKSMAAASPPLQPMLHQVEVNYSTWRHSESPSDD